MHPIPRQVLLQCAHVFQQTLFPALDAEIGPLSQPLQLLSAVVNLVPLGSALSNRQASTGRPPRDRSAETFTRENINLKRAS